MNPWEEPKQSKLKWITIAAVVFAGLMLFSAMLLRMVQPSFLYYPPSEQTLDPARLQEHVEMLSGTLAPRDYKNHHNLEKTAGYISNHFARAAAQISEQVYEVHHRKYRNVIATFGPETPSRIVIGAHYDSYKNTPGADDNASGVAGLIELAVLLGRAELEQRVDLVAYTLEEPPFFRSGDMGSARHAALLRQEGVDIEAMLCLEMIGYFSDVADSQHFPSALIGFLYPDKGNFIAVIGATNDRKLAKQVKISMRSATDLPVHAMCAPQGFPGLDFSDHLNYWKNGYRAVMITDTAFLRNARYHHPLDTSDTLDYQRMAKVVLGVYEAVIRLANEND